MNRKMTYDSFFKDMSQMIIKQEEQKKRGHNDFNILSIVRKKYEEVGLHSKFIYSLLDREALHYQDDLFLKLFIKHVLVKTKNIGEIECVKREDLTLNIKREQRRIDFTIESSNYLIGIEMKLNASDETNQLSDYKEELDARNKLINDSKIVQIYYLTLDGSDASEISHNNIAYYRISFQKHILMWIENCIDEVYNISNLNLLISQYRDIVLQVTKQYKGKVMTLMEYLTKEVTVDKQEDYIKLLDSLTVTYQQQKNEIKKDYFLKTLVKDLNDNISNGYKVKFTGAEEDINKRYKVNIKFYKDNDWKVVYWLRFNSDNMSKMYWAIAKTLDNIDLKHIRVKYPKLNNPSKYHKSSTSLLWDFSQYDLDKNIYNIINYSDTLSKSILQEFNTVINDLKKEYDCTLDDINNLI